MMRQVLGCGRPGCGSDARDQGRALDQRELAAGRGDVPPARISNKRKQSLFEKHTAKLLDPLRLGRAIGQFARIPRNQIYLRAQI